MDNVTVLPRVVRRAEQLIISGENARACRLLAQALADIDPVTERHDARLIEAAIIYAYTLSYEPDIPDRADLQLTSARYAETAARTRYGCSSELWHQAADCYARVCTKQGLTFDAVALADRKLAALRTYGPADRIPAARDELATALHNDGQCAEARTEIHDALHDWLRIRAHDPRSGRHLVLTYTGILAGCGHTADAQALLREHADVIAVKDTTKRQVDAVSTAMRIAMTERDHPPLCTVRPAPARGQPTSSPLPADRWKVWETLLLNRHRALDRTRSALSTEKGPRRMTCSRHRIPGPRARGRPAVALTVITEVATTPTATSPQAVSEPDTTSTDTQTA